MNPQPTLNPPPGPGWWKRNWKWFVPASLVCILLFGAGIIALIVTIVMGSVKSSEPYTRALAQAKADPTLIAEMGSPIEAGWYVTGSISSTGPNSYANFYIPIHGPNKSGSLHVIALKSPFAEGTDNWKITELEVNIDGRSEPIALESDAGNKPPATAELESDSPEIQLPPIKREVEADPGIPGAPGVKSGVVGGVPVVNPDEPPPSPAPGKSLPKVISGGVLNGRAISLPKPVIPPIAKAANITGTVVVQVMVDENGKVTSANAVSGHPLLRQAAVQAAYGARFSPTKLSGQPVKVSGVITYNFVQ